MVDGVIFDCDGVLIDIRESYNRAISKSVAYILAGMTGCSVPESLISDEIIHLFRRTGGFNNDWDTVYGILMFMLSRLPKEIRRCLEELMEKIGNEESPFKRFMLIKDYAKRESQMCILKEEFFAESIKALRDFTKLLDFTGRESVDKNLLRIYGSDGNFQRFYSLLKRFLHSTGDVGKSIISTVFEEFFCGVSLFEKVYGITPQFNNGSGLIENERLIVQSETLDSLISILGKRNLGITSGSRRKSAEHILGDLIEKFNPKALVFAESVEMAERSMKKALKKPHPFSLLKAAEGFGEFSFLIYVGDSMEDAIMASEAANLNGRVLFAGVYRYTSFEEEKLRIFLDHGCDLILPTVNELPLILKELRRKED
ncbi:hypothetical protein DRO38_01080 [Candidatus Bathyarchaeota archaeon]|nr:MAG: hypothetical protein DRO38_01080 [Candidatus Bathyarchaeota archaeon]